MSVYEGRVYNARYHDGKIYVLQFCNKEVVGATENDLYRIFCSSDNGYTFKELCVVPFESTKGRFYGTMKFEDNGKLIVYAYNENCETEMDYAISEDGGETWTKTGVCYLAKRIRNPQVAILDGQYILHGRESCSVNRFILYTSADGIVWDEGHIIVDLKPGCSFYSNNVIVNKDGRDRLLVQFSQTFTKSHRVNIHHLWIETE